MLGIEAEMIFGGRVCRGRWEVPLPTIGGNGMEVRFKPKIIVAKSPTAWRLNGIAGRDCRGE